MDYGHERFFGTFITPAAQRPQNAVLEARILLTYVAACTSRVRLSHNVLNLSLRPPVLLARAAASFDLRHAAAAA